MKILVSSLQVFNISSNFAGLSVSFPRFLRLIWPGWSLDLPARGAVQGEDGGEPEDPPPVRQGDLRDTPGILHGQVAGGVVV